MKRKPNFEIIFKTLVKRHLEKKMMRELRAQGISISATESGKFNKLTEEAIKRITPKA